MKRGHSHYNRFIDFEAGVDEELETDDDEERDMEDMFINDTNRDVSVAAHRGLRDDERVAEEDALAMAYDELLDRVLGNSRLQARNSNTFDEEYYTSTFLKNVCLEQLDNDYPLYKVECKVGSEELIIMKLLHCTNENLHLLAAFTPGHIRGCVYLECIMNDNLKHVLLQTIGINHSRQGLRYRRINNLEAHKLLILPKDNRTVEVGDWVRIKKGVYKGDTAYITKTHNWGVSVLLAPRLDYTPMDGKRKQKRKLSTVKPPPKLFNPVEFHHNTDIEPRKCQEGTYYVGRMEFIDGLLLKSYDFSSITPPVFDIPWNLASIFAASSNMDVTMCIPRPQEWTLHEHDKVIVLSSGEKGSVHEMNGKYVMIDIGERGVHAVVWYDIRKDIATGDYVIVVSGPHCGYKGWVMEINIDVAKILNTIRQGNNIGDETYGDTPIEIHVNCVQITNPPFHFAQPPSNTKLNFKATIRHPWCGASVILTKIGHPQKGEKFMVTDVSHEHLAVADIKLQIQTFRYNPYMPNAKIVVHYDDIVEASTRKQLKEFFAIGDANIAITTQNIHTTLSAIDSAGSCTPMPSESSSTPAWNPSSQTPMHIDQGTSSSLSICASEPIELKHVLLNPLLLDVVVKATVHGGNYNNQIIEVHILCNNTKLGLYRRHFKTLYHLEPGWVTLIHPSPTHDHGLLVVIEGEHCGKYVRRITHLNRDDGRVIILAVVNRTKGSADILTGEQLLLPSNVLCKSIETKKERAINDTLMAPLREPFR